MLIFCNISLLVLDFFCVCVGDSESRLIQFLFFLHANVMEINVGINIEIYFISTISYVKTLVVIKSKGPFNLTTTRKIVIPYKIKLIKGQLFTCTSHLSIKCANYIHYSVFKYPYHFMSSKLLNLLSWNSKNVLVTLSNTASVS